MQLMKRCYIPSNQSLHPVCTKSFNFRLAKTKCGFGMPVLLCREFRLYQGEHQRFDVSKNFSQSCQ